MTITRTKRVQFPKRYLVKDARTKVYRALYGEVIRGDNRTHDKGEPSLNEHRRLPQGFHWQNADEVFTSLACTTVNGEIVSNGLFPPQRWEELRQRIETLKKVYR